MRPDSKIYVAGHRGLAGSAIRYPPLDGERLGIYFSHLVASGFLPPPPAPLATDRADGLARITRLGA